LARKDPMVTHGGACGESGDTPESGDPVIYVATY